MAGDLSPVESGGFSQFIAGNESPLPVVTDQEAKQDAQQLVTDVQQIVNQDQVAAEADTNIAQAQQRRSEAGAFWAAFLKDPEAALQSEIEKAFPGDSMASGVAKDLLRGLKSGQMDPESSLSAYSDPYQPTAFSGPAVISGGGGGEPVAAKGLARFGKRQDGPTSCSRSLVVGTVTGVARVAAGALSSQLRGIASAHQTLGDLGGLYPDLPDFLMTLPADAMTLLLTDKSTLLDTLSSLVAAILKIALTLTQADYGFDHRSLILRAMAELEEADRDLADVERVLLGGGKFQKASWDRAEGNIDDAADILQDPDFPLQSGTKQVRIIALLSSMNATAQVLLCRQNLIEKIYANLASFPSSFSASAQYDNLFGPILDQIRCLLKAVIGEMTSALSSGLVAQLFVQEQKWYVELRALLSFMGAAAHLAAAAPAASSWASSFSSGLDQDQDELNNANDFNALMSLLEGFSSLVRAVLFRAPLGTQRLQQIAAAIQREIGFQKANVEEIENRLAAFKGSFARPLSEVATVMAGLESYLTSKDLLGMVDALKQGDVKGFFEASTRDSSIEEGAMDRAARLLRYSAETGGREYRALLETYTELRGRVRSEQLFRRLTDQAADLFIREVKEDRLPANNRMLRAAKRVNAGLQTVENRSLQVDAKIAQVQSRIDATVGAVGRAQTKAEEAVTRVTQARPVSCASR